MSKYSEDTLTGWTKPPSNTEENKLSNSEKMVRDAINEDETLKNKYIEVFGQGSYANDTNVRLNSDIDINVCYSGGFYYDLSPELTKEDAGISGTPSNYTSMYFKNDVEQALINKFGSNDVVRKNKCLTVLGNTNRVEIDVVPTWEYRRYYKNGSYNTGVQFQAENLNWVINYPKQHIKNGKSKNLNTQKRYKRLTRIHRKLRYKMKDCLFRSKYPPYFGQSIQFVSGQGTHF